MGAMAISLFNIQGRCGVKDMMKAIVFAEVTNERIYKIER